MSRPTIEDDSKLSASLPPVRCTAAEKERILSKARQANLSLTEYIRSMALKGNIIVRQSSTDFETISQLKKIGVNFNQQIKKYNATGKLTFELLDVNKKLETLIDKLLERL